MQDARRAIEKAVADIEGPLHIAQECLYQRENRQGKQKLIFSLFFICK